MNAPNRSSRKDSRSPETVAELWPGGVGRSFTAIPDALFAHRTELGLGSREFHVLVVLIRHRWSRTRPVWVSYQTIASESGLSLSSVRRAVSELKRLNLINVERRRTARGTQLVNHYDLSPLVNRLAALVRERVVSTNTPERPDAQTDVPPVFSETSHPVSPVDGEVDAVEEVDEEEIDKALIGPEHFAELKAKLAESKAARLVKEPTPDSLLLDERVSAGPAKLVAAEVKP
jgi:DNA-binding transcriptional regulator GbsR (MarR family)